MAPFSGRSVEAKARMVRKEGGTVESEKAVEAGLDWIARHQRPDGGWSLDISPMCKGSGCPGHCDSVSDTAATGLALLPLLGAGHSHTQKGRYQETIQRGLAWLMKVQGRDGEMYTGGSMHTLYYSHAIGAMALCEAYGVTRDKRLPRPGPEGHRVHRSDSEQVRRRLALRDRPGRATPRSSVGRSSRSDRPIWRA